MKKVLSLLVAFVFLQTQSWALSGGPTYPGNQQSLVGTYAGTLVGQLTIAAAQDVGANGLGVFVIGIPASGIGSGVFGYFDSGVSFFGTIIGIADPDKLTLNALMSGQATESETENLGGTIATLAVPTAFASGEFVANLESEVGTVGAQSGFRLTGTASLGVRVVDQTTGVTGVTVNNTLSVDGFQQSTTVSSTVNLSTLTGTQQ